MRSDRWKGARYLKALKENILGNRRVNSKFWRQKIFKALDRGGVVGGGEAFVARVRLVRENSWRLILRMEMKLILYQ